LSPKLASAVAVQAVQEVFTPIIDAGIEIQLNVSRFHRLDALAAAGDEADGQVLKAVVFVIVEAGEEHASQQPMYSFRYCRISLRRSPAPLPPDWGHLRRPLRETAGAAEDQRRKEGDGGIRLAVGLSGLVLRFRPQWVNFLER
jgi:hypothetical protein